MKVEYVSMLKKIGSKVYFGRMDGLVMEYSRTSPPAIVFHLDKNFSPMTIATNSNMLAVGGLDEDDSYMLIKKIGNDTLFRQNDDVRFFVSPNYFVNNDFCLCELQPTGITPRMPLDLLDSEPLIYDVDTTGSSLLAIARRGTIYTIDCSHISSYYPLTFSICEGEIHEKMDLWITERESGNDNFGPLSDKKVGIINIEYGDPDDDEAGIEEDKHFDEIIDQRLPIRAHDPSSYISTLKLVNLNYDESPLVVSASRDHHIAVHDFSTHKKIYDSGWIDTLVFCCAQAGKKMIFGGCSGAVAVLDLDGFKCLEYTLPTDSSLYRVDVSDNKATFYTSDNSVLIVDLNTMKVIDVFAPAEKLLEICILGNNIFMLNEEFELTVERL